MTMAKTKLELSCWGSFSKSKDFSQFWVRVRSIPKCGQVNNVSVKFKGRLTEFPSGLKV